MPKQQPDAPGKDPYEERIAEALLYHERAWIIYDEAEEPKEEPLVRSIAYRFNISRTTLTRRLEGKSKAREEAYLHRQRLDSAEEKALVEWTLQMEAWGWPSRVEQLRTMAIELLHKKGDYEKLGKHRNMKFLSRHLELETRFCALRDKFRAVMHDSERISNWFDLYTRTIAENGILSDDECNMDEKGWAMGLQGSLVVICSKGDRSTVIQNGSRKWTTIIECVSKLGRILSLYIIFKGAQIMEE